MLRRYYDNCVFKPIYWQCGFVCLFLLSVMSFDYFFFLKEDFVWLKQQILKNQQLEAVLQAKKNKRRFAKQTQPGLSSYQAVSHYLEPSQVQWNKDTLIQHLAKLAIKENMVVKQISVERENIGNDHTQLSIHLVLLGSYKAFGNFYLLMRKQSYLVEMMQFKLEKNPRTYGENTLYADLFIQVHAFQ